MDNKANKIEYGIFTPYLFGSDVGGNPTYNTSQISGFYSKIDRVILATYIVGITSKGGMLGQIRIGGFPFVDSIGNSASNVRVYGVTSDYANNNIFAMPTYGYLRLVYSTNTFEGALYDTSINNIFYIIGFSIFITS